MSATKLSPVMAAYARLVAVYREWNACDKASDTEVTALLRRLDNAKGRLAAQCGGHNSQYVTMWQAAVKEARIPEEANDATHPQA